MGFSQNEQPVSSYIDPQVGLTEDKQPIYSYIDPDFVRRNGVSPPPPPPPPPPPASSPSGAVVITGAGGITFNLTFDSSASSAPAGFVTAVEGVAQGFANQLRGTATINLNVGWGEVAGYALPSNALGASTYNYSTYTYSQVVNALSAHGTSADDLAALTSLSGPDPTNGGHFVVPTALAENLGLLSYTGNDGAIGFGTGFSFTFDPMNRAVGGAYDFFGTAAHEISEVLGRVALLGNSGMYSVQDLFRYAGLNTRDLGAGGYFSPDGGKTNLDNFNTGGGDAGDWAGSAGFDSFDAFASSGVENLVTEADFRTMDTIGWNLISPYTGVSSADGSILMAGTTGSLLTSAGMWSFGSQQSGTSNYNILVNGQSAAGGGAVELEVANNGILYASNSQGQWYQWNGSGWGASSNPTPSPPPPLSPPPPPAAPPSLSLSPDGTILMPGSGGSLVTSAGTWTFGTTTTPYGNLILLNGQSAASGSAVELEVANNGNLYADNSQGQWWEWNGAGWGASSNPLPSPPPPPPPGVSPDGSILMAGSSGSLVTSAGAWSFSPTTNASGNLVLLNAQPAGNGSAVELEVANQGNLYADNAQGQWWQWTGSSWAASSNPSMPTLSPDGSILMAGATGNLVTSAGAWSFSPRTNASGNLVLLNAQPAGNGSAVELEVANQGNLYADNAQGQWWQWTGSSWAASSNPFMPTLSPDGSILMAGGTGNLVTSAGGWSFSTTTNASGNLILLNAQPAGNGSAVELEVANQGNLYADNAQGQWWQWNGSGWAGTVDPNPASGGGRVLTVGPGQQYSTIADAINASQNGDTIDVQAGTYTNDYATINTNITLQGIGGQVNMVSTGLIPNGKAILITNGNDTINNFSFSGAQVADGNGAGIRYQAGNLILNNDYFHDNQEGLLAASNPAGSITINHSEFAHNGDGSGFTHNLYVNEVGTLRIDSSYFHDAVVGHEIKSRADNTIITNSRIQDENGSASYSIDLPNGGRAVIENNIIQQGPNSQNPAMIANGEEGNVYGNSQLTVDFNTFLNDLTSSSALGVWNSTNATADISGDQFYGLTPSQLAAGLSSQSGNTFLGSEPALITTHPWLA